MEFTFSNRRWILSDEKKDAESDFALGLHIPRRWDKILNINACHIQQIVGNEILNFVRAESKKLGLKPYNQKTHPEPPHIISCLHHTPVLYLT